MSTVRVDMRLPADLLAAVDERRGDVPRTRFVVRALEAALGEGPALMAPTQHVSEQATQRGSGYGVQLGAPRYGPRRPRPKGTN